MEGSARDNRMGGGARCSRRHSPQFEDRRGGKPRQRLRDINRRLGHVSDRDASRRGNGGRRLPLSKWSAKNQASSSPCPPKIRARCAAASLLPASSLASPLGLTQQCQQALLLGNSLDLGFVTFRRHLGGGRSGRDLAPSCRTRFNAPLLGCGGLKVSGLRDGRG